MDDFDFTDEHRAAAAAAHVQGKALVIDRGPPEPEDDAPDHVKAAHAEWHEENDGPVHTVMLPIDAHEAAARDPERYLIVPRAAAEPVTVEERLNRIERIMEIGAFAPAREEIGDPDVEARHQAQDDAARAPVVDPAITPQPPAGADVAGTPPADTERQPS